jgi:hypothetical protein
LAPDDEQDDNVFWSDRRNVVTTVKEKPHIHERRVRIAGEDASEPAPETLATMREIFDGMSEIKLNLCPDEDLSLVRHNSRFIVSCHVDPEQRPN